MAKKNPFKYNAERTEVGPPTQTCSRAEFLEAVEDDPRADVDNVASSFYGIYDARMRKYTKKGGRGMSRPIRIVENEVVTA